MKRQNLFLRSQSFLISLILGTLLIFPSKLLAAPYYQGKIITIIVSFGPGGVFDRTARMLAKNLPKYIPGKPNIIVQNMPGGGSMVGANYLYEVAKPDGLTIGTFARGLPYAQLLKAQGSRFDLTKFSWIGSPSIEPNVLVIRSDLPYKTFDDLLKSKETLHFGCTSGVAVDTFFPMALKEYLGLKINTIQYPSGAEVNLAIERKEMDGRSSAYGGLKPFIARGVVRPILRGLVSEPGIEKLPVNVDYVTDKKAKTVMSLLSLPDKIGQPYVAPPKTPNDLLNILREAFSKWAKDPEVQEEGEKSMLKVEYITAEEALKIANYVLQQPPEIINEMNKFIKY